MKFFTNQAQISRIIHSSTKIGKFNTNTIENNSLVSDALFKLEEKLINLTKQNTKLKTKNFQVGVYVVYGEYNNQNILYIGATKNYLQRIKNHKSAFNSNLGHRNKVFQEFYNKIKQEKNLFHYQVLNEYFTFIPLYSYEINCLEKEMKSRSLVDYIVQNLETQVIEAFRNTQQFNIINLGPTLNQESFEFMTMPMSSEKQNYYNKLKDLATAQVLKEGRAVAQNQNHSFISNLTDFNVFSTEEIKNFKNASRKIRPVISMQTGQFFSSYKEVCESNVFNIANPDKISQLAKSDNPSLNQKDRNFRFASDEEIANQKYITGYDSVFNPGSFNSNPTGFTKTVPVIGPVFSEQNAMLDSDYSKYLKNTAFSLSEKKAYYISKSKAASYLERSD